MKKIINFYKRLSFLQGVAFAVTFTSAIGVAVTVGSLTTFSPNTTIQSSQVNANFLALKTAIESVTSGQTYMGNHDASTAVDPGGATLAGEYYIITTAGTINAVTYAVGDWIMYDGTSYNKVPGSSTTVFGRSGAVTATEGDYSLDQLSAVTITSPSVNQVLQFNGSEWVNGPLSYTETDPGVQNFAKTSLPTCVAGEFLKANGSVFSCVSTTALTANKVMITDGSGQASASAITSTELNYLGSVTSSIQTQINNKEPSITAGTTVEYLRGDKTWSSFETSVLASSLTGFSAASNVAITSADNVLMGLGKAQAQLDNKIGSSGGTLTAGTLSVSGAGSITVPAPVSASEVANKAYVDSFGQWIRNSANIYFTSGNVGIGLSNPSVALDVTGDIKTTGHVKTQYIRTIIAGSPTSPNISNLSDPATGIFYPGAQDIGFTNNSTETMRITSGGSVGIGTASPGYKLDVAGDINAVNVRASGVALTSDRRLKKNIVTISNALEKLLGLRGVEFDWRNNDTHDTGVIAQEVEAKFPNLVITNKDGMKSVKYANMAGVFIEASKDLNKKIVNLEAENKMLKNYLCTRDPMAPFCEE